MITIRPAQFYNTLTRSVVPLHAVSGRPIRLYACGPTTYDVSHAGHGRTAVLCDLLVRHLRASAYEVTYVRNITDVEDKILVRARQQQEDPLALSDRFARLYQEDLARLMCLPPDHEPRVSGSMAEIVTFVEGLISLGVAYVVPTSTGSDVWYSVRSFSTYGKLSGRSLDDLRAGEGLEERGKTLQTHKRDPLDFALWKSVPESEWSFASPWGNGRPGWHVECSAMCERYLGFGLDIHVGGMDLIFPHHENEIAQSEALHPSEGPFCRIWLHGGFLNVDKEKMSKSLGNFVTMRDCFERNDPEALRLFYLSSHYRRPVEFTTNILPSGRVTFPVLDEAERRIDLFYQTRERLRGLMMQKPTTTPDASKLANSIPASFKKLASLVVGAVDRVADALNDDLNAPLALAILQELAKGANEICDVFRRTNDVIVRNAAIALASQAHQAFESISGVLGVLQADAETYFARTQQQRLRLRELRREDLDAKVAARWEARQAKDFARADGLRDELIALDIELFDSPTGTTWRLVPNPAPLLDDADERS